MLGSTEPRLWTPPLRELNPDTSYGFDVIEFADETLKAPLDPWQQWLVIHAGELLPDGRPRFRKVLVLVARQNGKTHVVVVLSLFWLFIDRVEMVLGTSTKLDYAAESWRKAIKLAKRVREFRPEITHRDAIRKANGEQVFWRSDADERELDEGSRYKIAASNEEGGRSLTIDRLVLDELRQHHDYSAHDASVPATNAVPDAQIWAMSNAGNDNSIVLNDMRDDALTYIRTGKGDSRLGLFEWSCLPGADPLDVRALAQANPNLNRRNDQDALLGDAATAVAKGGKKLAGFKTENMCIRVPRMDPAISPVGWENGADPGDLLSVRRRVVLCLDVSMDNAHATLVAAAVLADGRVRVEVVAAWDGPQWTTRFRKEFREKVGDIRPRKVGWFPGGPAAGLATEMTEQRREGWPPKGVKFEEIRRDVPAVCMGFAVAVDGGGIAHSHDPLLDDQVEGAEKLWAGDTWRFIRKGAGHVDAVYGASGAVHLARTLPPPPRKPIVVHGRPAA
ncbi:hypothetical protein EV186_103618 [Labedaea rhizosphaerae]|uniref:Phage terminase large subunit-like protein n=1 Tax=Labedaea rhizosphaerae TaxID=598644 RepID=A0A4R6SDB5_LABRH|nr:hypothetical protein EV186_103618 [Labedaea rhizosphaerae]